MTTEQNKCAIVWRVNEDSTPTLLVLELRNGFKSRSVAITLNALRGAGQSRRN